MNHKQRVSIFVRALAILAVLNVLPMLCLPAMTQGITIKVHAGTDKNSSSITASGSVQHVVTKLERKTFGIEDAGLKSAVNKSFGKSPNDAYVHSPTPWDDLYKSYGWRQVHTVLEVKSAQIIEITSVPSIVATRTFSNNSTVKATFNAGISEQVTNTTENSWSNTNTIGVDQKFGYEVSFLGTGGKGETSFSYSHTWGETKTESQTINIGSETGVSVELSPGEAVKAVLSASRGKMKVRITYLAYLSGQAAVNYNPTFKSHHFWGLDIAKIMKDGGLSNSREFTEDLEIGFYSNSTIEVRNAATNRLKTLINVAPNVHE